VPNLVAPKLILTPKLNQGADAPDALIPACSRATSFKSRTSATVAPVPSGTGFQKRYPASIHNSAASRFSASVSRVAKLPSLFVRFPHKFPLAPGAVPRFFNFQPA